MARIECGIDAARPEVVSAMKTVALSGPLMVAAPVGLEMTIWKVSFTLDQEIVNNSKRKWYRRFGHRR